MGKLTRPEGDEVHEVECKTKHNGHVDRNPPIDDSEHDEERQHDRTDIHGEQRSRYVRLFLEPARKDHADDA